MDCIPQSWAPTQLSYVTCAVSGIICLLTVLGNGIIILVVIRDPLKKLHTPFYYFVVNLAVSDWIFGVIAMPVSVHGHYQETKGKLEKSLKSLHLSTFICGSGSILSIVALAVDRYIAIKHPIKYRQYLSWKHCVIATAIIWILSVSIPFLYFHFQYINYLFFYAHSSILIAFLVTCFVHWNVVSHLNRQATELHKILRLNEKEGKAFRMRRLKQETSVTRVLLLIIFTFIGTYIPATVMIYILRFCATCNCDLRHVLRDFQFLLMSANSFMNPFICTIRLRYFKKSIQALLKKLQFPRNNKIHVENNCPQTFFEE